MIEQQQLDLDLIRSQANMQKLFYKNYPLLVENANLIIALCDRIKQLEHEHKHPS